MAGSTGAAGSRARNEALSDVGIAWLRSLAVLMRTLVLLPTMGVIFGLLMMLVASEGLGAALWAGAGVSGC